MNIFFIRSDFPCSKNQLKLPDKFKYLFKTTSQFSIIILKDFFDEIVLFWGKNFKFCSFSKICFTDFVWFFFCLFYLHHFSFISSDTYTVMFCSLKLIFLPSIWIIWHVPVSSSIFEKRITCYSVFTRIMKE